MYRDQHNFFDINTLIFKNKPMKNLTTEVHLEKTQDKNIQATKDTNYYIQLIYDIKKKTFMTPTSRNGAQR